MTPKAERRMLGALRGESGEAVLMAFLRSQAPPGVWDPTPHLQGAHIWSENLYRGHMSKTHPRESDLTSSG